MAIIQKSKKRKISIAIALSTVVVVIGVAVVVICHKRGNVKENTENAENAENTEYTTDIEIETFEKEITEDIADSERYVHYNCIDLFPGLAIGDVVDIRVNFPNGEDYVVVSHKIIISMDESGIVLKINEEELLKMSSAKIDMNKYGGTYIYATKYLNDKQMPAKSYYLLNEYVLSLCEWNPNLVDKIFSQDNLKKRYDFEQNLVNFQIEKEAK